MSTQKLPQSHTPNITHKSELHRCTLHNSRRELTQTAEFSLPLLFSLTQLKSSIHTFRSSSTTNLTRLPPAENSLGLKLSLHSLLTTLVSHPQPRTNCKRASVSLINSRSDTRKNEAFYTVADVTRCGCVTSLPNAEIT
jgi:hypothetical protein